MRYSAEESRRLALAQRVARLATVSEADGPHLVPVTFAVSGELVVIGVDEKPKSTFNLKRLRNIRSDPRVALCWDRYDEDWSLLWWVRADGVAAVAEDGWSWERAWETLTDKYEQYRHVPHTGPIIVVEVTRWSGWAHG